jgi:hypothetical protein
MPSCPSCGADKAPAAANAPCARCGAAPSKSPAAIAAPELDVPKRAGPAPPRPVAAAAEMKIELAAMPAPIERVERSSTRAEAASDLGDVAFDASLLANYGDAPGHWIVAPVYAWRVLKRQRELKRTLAGRRDEAKRAHHEAEDALVALAERVRPAVEKQAAFAQAVEELRGAEDVLRSRDRVLASEQDAQTARLASVDARLAKLEADLAQAQAEERSIAAELASAQAALARGDAKLRRAESELRSAMQRETDGTRA